MPKGKGNGKENDIEGYDLFQEKILNKSESDSDINAPSKPLEVQSLKFEDMTEEQKKEQEAIYRGLEDKYCVCNHSKDKHVDRNGKCHHSSTRFYQGKLQIFSCQCLGFKSKKAEREEIASGNVS